MTLHGQAAWDQAVAEQAEIDAAGGVAESTRLSEEELVEARAQLIDNAAPIGTGTAILLALFALILTTARGVSPSSDARPIMIGAVGIILALLVDIILVSPVTSSLVYVVLMLVPFGLALYGVGNAMVICGRNELIRVVFPPLVLIVAVLGSILGGITNPTPAAALGAGGAIMLAAYRKLTDLDRNPRIIIWSTFAIIICILIGINFDLRVNQADVSFENWIGFLFAYAAYLYALFGLLFACWILFSSGVLTPVVRETAKVTSMVFTISDRKSGAEPRSHLLRR